MHRNNRSSALFGILNKQKALPFILIMLVGIYHSFLLINNHLSDTISTKVR